MNIVEKISSSILVIVISFGMINTYAQSEYPVESLAQEVENSKEIDDNSIVLLVYSELRWIGQIQDGEYVTHMIGGQGDEKFVISCGETNVVSVSINPTADEGILDAYFIKDGKILKTHTISTPGDSLESTIDCTGEGIFEESGKESNISYIAIGIGAAVAAGVIIIIKKQPFLGPRKFRV